MPQLGPAEILVIVLVALLVFGPKRLPEVGRQVGHGLRELRKLQTQVKAEIDEVLDLDGSRAASATNTLPEPASPPPLPPPPAVDHAPPGPASERAPSRFRPPAHASPPSIPASDAAH